MSSLVVAAFSVLAGCAKPMGSECGGGGHRFLLPWPDKTGAYSFQEVNIETLNSPYKMSGQAAKIFFESKLTDQGFQGDVAEPHLTRSGDICVPTDADSVATLSAYAQMERLYRFDQKLGIASQISWPRAVGVQIHLQDNEGGLTENNGLYFPESDSMAVVPYTLEGTPLAINHGILAHEHFHAHFQTQVLNAINSVLNLPQAGPSWTFAAFAMKPRVEDVDGADTKSVYGLNQFVLRAWNEGLADLYAAISQGRPDFFSDSFPSRLSERSVAGPFETMRTSADLQYYAHDRTVTVGQLKAMSYQEGTRMARLFYYFAQKEDAQEFLRDLMSSLKDISESVMPSLERKYLEFDAIVPILLRGKNLEAQDCATIERVVSKPTFIKEFMQCSGVR
jgi:hypothetical protein